MSVKTTLNNKNSHKMSFFHLASLMIPVHFIFLRCMNNVLSQVHKISLHTSWFFAPSLCKVTMNASSRSQWRKDLCVRYIACICFLCLIKEACWSLSDLLLDLGKTPQIPSLCTQVHLLLCLWLCISEILIVENKVRPQRHKQDANAC